VSGYSGPVKTAADYVPRRAAAQVSEALNDTRIVIINGARQVGKSTLAERVLHAVPRRQARFLDDPQTRLAAENDPVGFLDFDGLMLIDEVQRVPGLWLAIKNIVDRDPRPGRFILTGSARLLALQSLPDALPGRSETIELWPLSQGEIDGKPDGFVDAAFSADGVLSVDESQLRRSDYLARIARGGYPTAVQRDVQRRRDRFFSSYLSDIVVRDIKQVADIERAADMRRLITLLAARCGGMINMAKLASELTITEPTVRRYIQILETIYLVQLIPAWSSGATKRVTRAPKLMFVDSGLASYLQTPRTSEQSGGLMENFVMGELARQLTWSETAAALYHYHDRDGHEVDAILEDNSGRVIGIEVKSAQSVRAEDLLGLRYLKQKLGSRMHAGYILYCGADSLSFGDGLGCLPISALWTSG
jgi:predicted AAA+ superfamily ATPase